MDDSLLAPFDITVHLYIYIYILLCSIRVYASDVQGECWGMQCLELDTFQALRGQGQISDINKDGHMAQL